MVIEEGQTEQRRPRTWLVIGLLVVAALGFGGTYVRSIAGIPGQGANVGIQYIADLTVAASGGDLSVTMPFNSSPLKNDDGSVAVGVRMVMTVTKPDASTVTFRQTTDGDGRIRGQIYGSVVNQVGTYTLTVAVDGGGPSAAAFFIIAERAQLDRDSQVFTGNNQVFRNDANSTTAFSVQNALGAATLNVDTTNSEVEVVNLIASGTISGNGSGLTSLNASNISSGTLADARLSGNVTVQGNAFNGISQLVQTNGAGALPALSGANLTSLNASNLASGTVADARLSANVTTQGNVFNGLSQLVQTTAGGALPALSGVNLTSLNASNVSSGTLADARLSANVALLDRDSQTFSGNSQLFKNTVDSTTAFRIQNAAGTQTLLAADTTANKIVVTNIEGAGSGLTTLNASNISSGTLADARLSGNVTVQGNAFNGISQLVQTNGAGALPALSGANLTSLNASNLASGTVADARLSANVTTQGNVFNGLSQLVQTTAGGALPALSGVNLTSLNASNVSSGTLADARLSANVALLNGTGPQTFTGNDKFTGTLAHQNAADSTTAFQVQNAAGTTLLGIDTTNSRIFSGIADGATAIGFQLNTPSYVTAGAKLLSLKNNAVEKFAIDKDGLITTTSVNSTSIVDGSIVPDDTDSSYLDKVGVSSTATSRRGKSIIATEETRTNTAYGTLTTPDQVTVTLPTDGVIVVLFNAYWKESVSGEARSALLVGANQLKFQNVNVTNPSLQDAALGWGTANIYVPLSSSPVGLQGRNSGTASTDAGSSVTTGQSVVGPWDGNLKPGGPVYIFAAAGTYTISVQFKASSGSVTAKERKLWVWTMGF